MFNVFKWFGNYFGEISKLKKIAYKSNELERYRNLIYDCSKNDKNLLIGNFSYEGYEYIFSELIFNASKSIYVFCEDYNKIFTDELFPLFLFKALSGIKVRIITYNGKMEDKFEKLNDSHADCKYYSLRASDMNKLNNYIVVDDKSYWIDDKSWFTRKDFSELKACVNFHDPNYCSNLLYNFNQIVENLK